MKTHYKMTPQQKHILKNSIAFYKKLDSVEKVDCEKTVQGNLKNFTDHENALPAKIFLRICKNL